MVILAQYESTSPLMIKVVKNIMVLAFILNNLFAGEFNQPGVSCATVSALVQVRFTFLTFSGKKIHKTHVIFFLSF